jgi:hypothetical protein
MADEPTQHEATAFARNRPWPTNPWHAWAAIAVLGAVASAIAWLVEPRLVDLACSVEGACPPEPPDHTTIRVALIVAGLCVVGFLGAVLNAFLSGRDRFLNLQLPRSWNGLTEKLGIPKRWDAMTVLLVSMIIGIVIGTTVFK